MTGIACAVRTRINNYNCSTNVLNVMSSTFMPFVYVCYIRTPFKLAMLKWMLLYIDLNKKVITPDQSSEGRGFKSRPGHKNFSFKIKCHPEVVQHLWFTLNCLQIFLRGQVPCLASCFLWPCNLASVSHSTGQYVTLLLLLLLLLLLHLQCGCGCCDCCLNYKLAGRFHLFHCLQATRNEFVPQRSHAKDLLLLIKFLLVPDVGLMHPAVHAMAACESQQIIICDGGVCIG